MSSLSFGLHICVNRWGFFLQKQLWRGNAPPPPPGWDRNKTILCQLGIILLHLCRPTLTILRAKDVFILDMPLQHHGSFECAGNLQFKYIILLLFSQWSQSVSDDAGIVTRVAKVSRQLESRASLFGLNHCYWSAFLYPVIRSWLRYCFSFHESSTVLSSYKNPFLLF